MAEDYKKISELTSIENVYTTLVAIDTFLSSDNSLFAVAKSNDDTFKIKGSQFYKVLKDSISTLGSTISSVNDKVTTLNNGITSIWYIDSDIGFDTNNGKTFTSPLATISRALTLIGTPSNTTSYVFYINSVSDYAETLSTAFPTNSIIITKSSILALTGITATNLTILSDYSVALANASSISKLNVICDTYVDNGSNVSDTINIIAKSIISYTITTNVLNVNLNSKFVCVYEMDSTHTHNRFVVKANTFRLSGSHNLGLSGIVSIVADKLVTDENLKYQVHATTTSNNDENDTENSTKVYLNVGRIESNGLMILDYSGTTSTTILVYGYIGYYSYYGTTSLVDSSSLSSSVTYTERLTYAGISLISATYDKVVSTTNELKSALLDSSVTTIFVDKETINIDESVAVSGTKKIYGTGKIANVSGITLSGNDVYVYIPFIAEDFTLNSNLYVSGIQGSQEVDKTISGNGTLYYQKKTNILGGTNLTLTQSFWNNEIPLASTETFGVAKFNSTNFSVVDGVVSLLGEGSALQNRYIDATNTDSAFYIGNGTITSNEGTSGITNSSGVITLSNGISFAIVTVHIKSTLADVSSAILWYESSLRIGYYNSSDVFVPIKEFKCEHSTDSEVQDNTFVFPLDCSKILTNKLGIYFTSGVTLTTSTYISSIVEIAQNGSGSSNGKVSVDGTDSLAYLYDKITTSSPIQKRITDGTVEIYQDPVDASPVSSIITPPIDCSNDSVNSISGTGSSSMPGMQWHIFKPVNYFALKNTDLMDIINVNTQSATALTILYMSMFEYDETTNKAHLVCVSNDIASSVNSNTGLQNASLYYINPNYNTIKPSKYYYAGLVCDQSALQVIGISSVAFNMTNPFPGITFHNVTQAITPASMVENLLEIDLSTSSAISHQEGYTRACITLEHI